jgi:hypothetical protein
MMVAFDNEAIELSTGIFKRWLIKNKILFVNIYNGHSINEMGYI